MASDKKKPEAAPAPKNEAAPKTESTSGEAAAKTEVNKTEVKETANAAPSNYSRGEGQKPVTAAYKENWNAIFAKKTAKKKKRS